jgi:hypothetical protein
VNNLHLKQFPLISITDKKSTKETYERNALLSKSFIINEDINHIFTPKKEKLNYVLNPLHGNKKQNGFLLEIIFNGLNLSAKRLKLNRSKYKIDVHRAEKFICKEHTANSFKSRVHKRRLVFFSYDRRLLYKISYSIKRLKLTDVYTGKGLFSRTDRYKKKIGKIWRK